MKTITYFLAATGLAAALYRLSQRSLGAATSGRQPAAAPGAGEAPPSTLDTPTRSDPLQDMKLANAGMGSTANTHHEDLLAPPQGDEQQSEDVQPGLPDFPRGA